MYNDFNIPSYWNLLIFTPIRKTFNRIFHIIILWGLFACLPAIAVDDDYLKALETEANNTASMANKPSPKPRVLKASGLSNSARKNFENLLQFELPSTYTFYSKLTSEQQVSVIKHYIQEQKISSASKLIFDLYFDHNKK